ncbi:hypothetical protein JX580_09710 [Thiomicrospira microaerophila]|uniref:hypothetical protein n=1 Tax=Thiomicrospira microaerophila TaxID=406020 RepID=UPI00200E9DC3|nr:hypothetical protein [Thiomicrospira microaerophila]UQB41932.1 hypothetical protein JX580_09710 [Thiomicrospira microaerophila]
MGKKSRLKRERRELKEHGLSENSSRALVLLDEHSQSVYRFFQEEWQADALARGDVWLSTLETCRAYENPEQGDSEEGHETYNSGHAVGGSSDPELVEVARRSGIHIGPGCSNITISNNIRKSVLHDAYVLCTTTEFSPEKLGETFGRYCVEITNPRQFFIAVSEVLEGIVSIREAAAGKVIYKNRLYTGMERPPGPIGFVKPPDLYASQKEFRLLWLPREANGLNPFLLKCPEVGGLCKRIA